MLLAVLALLASTSMYVLTCLLVCPKFVHSLTTLLAFKLHPSTHPWVYFNLKQIQSSLQCLSYTHVCYRSYIPYLTKQAFIYLITPLVCDVGNWADSCEVVWPHMVVMSCLTFYSFTSLGYDHIQYCMGKETANLTMADFPVTYHIILKEFFCAIWVKACIWK